MTPQQAKKVILDELIRRGLPFARLSARTVDFTDLARDSMIFVKIHGWKPNPAWSELRQVALKAGFGLEAGR